MTKALPSEPPNEITVAAAASLQFAFNEIKTIYESETGNRVTLVFGSTGQLVQQIENGAPYDLIASANTEYVERLAEQNLVLPGSVRLYAQGRIVLAVNAASGVKATELSDLLSADIRHIAIANPITAPYGLAAQQALQSSDIWDRVQDKIVYAENIRQALQYVQSGDAEAGIVALAETDVPEVTWTLIDSSLHEPLNQALAVVSTSPQPQIAAQFAEYITSKQGLAIMKEYGYELPEGMAVDPSLSTP